MKALPTFLWLISVLFLCNVSVSYGATQPSFADSPEQVTPLLNGQFAPDVMVQTAFGEDVNLRELIELQPSLVLFYRGGWCPYCNRQFKDLLQVEQRILDLGYQIIAISPDSPERLQQQKTHTDFDVTLISDTSLKAIEAFGLGYFLEDKLAQQYRSKVGAILVTDQGTEKVVLPVPAAYVFDASGLVYFQYVNPNHRVQVSPVLLLYAAQLAK
jgi:peroxiredoxin